MRGTLLLATLLSFAQISSLSASVLSFSQFKASSPEQKAKPSLEATPPLKEEEKDKALKKKCPSTALSSDAPSSEASSHHGALVFISFSVPIETWKEHSYALQRIKGAFVLRGLPSNSFEELSSKILELRSAGVQAEILLDPAAFERFDIQAVPSIVLQQEEQHGKVPRNEVAYDNAMHGAVRDQVSGNIPIVSALTLFAEKGEAKERALKLLQEMKR